jgi:phosphate transport system ATP-binding protein
MAEPALRLQTQQLTAVYGKFTAVKDVSLAFRANTVNALIGPSGCGKSTCCDRVQPDATSCPTKLESPARVLLDGENIYGPKVSPMQPPAQQVGMVFQKPTPFPTMTIYDNVAAGIRHHEKVNKADARRAWWNWRCARPRCGTRSRTSLGKARLGLSGGQQQRLCIARDHRPAARGAAAGRADRGARPGSTSASRSWSSSSSRPSPSSS